MTLRILGPLRQRCRQRQSRINGQTQESATFQFPIEAQPLTALLTFEIANPRVDSPPEVYLNGQNIGPASLMLPDLLIRHTGAK